MNDDPHLVIAADTSVAAAVSALADRSLVFFAGLPGTGKSLFVHQVAHVAQARGRVVHLLQWDVARPVFEAAPAGARFPQAGGVTHPVIRKAAGLWVRRALVEWRARHAERDHLLVGETPFVGHRFIELARRETDGAEPLLAAESCRFVLPVPSHSVRAHLERERERRAARPLHPREREDAPPRVLRDLWRDLTHVARALDVVGARSAADAASSGWDPDLYRRVYEAILAHRHVDVLHVRSVLPTARMSVYDFRVAPVELTPSAEEAERLIGEVERRHPDLRALEAEVARWWSVS